VKLSQIGERKAIKEISKILSDVDLTDDCARVTMDDRYLLVSTDLISEKTHMPKVMRPWQIGWFITAINLSDIAAKGGMPIGVLLALGLPRDLDENFLKGIIKGAKDCADKYNTEILGGDTKESEKITIAGTAFGIVSKKNYMPRLGIKPDDLIAVTGTLGRAALGYQILKNNVKGMEKFIKYVLEPKPRVKEGIALGKTLAVKASMDISDGLSSSLYQLSEINEVGFEIYEKNLPIHPGIYTLKKVFPDLDEISLATNFGGEYELLLAIKPGKIDVVEKTLKKLRCKLTVIGKAIGGKKIYLVSNGKRKKMENKGYEHFKTVLDKI